MIRSQNEIYESLDEAFDKAKHPLTCVDLMDIPTVRAAAINRWGNDVQEATEKLSDTIAFMWRRGILERFPATSTRSRARWAYGRKNVVIEEDAEPIPYEPKVRTKNKGELEIVQQNGEVILNFEKFTVVIRPN